MPMMDLQPEAKSPTQLIDWIALCKRYGNRQGFIDKLFRISYASHVDMLEKLRSAIQKSDLEAIAFIAHGLRGTASNLEAQEVRDWATKTEENVRAGRPDHMALADELARRLERLLAELAGRLKGGADSAQ
ncbi:MAG: Hpt domain-containing protein [Thiobacillaceae bacterium]|jgi:HPt (histidine-containing phosphotransfer) domain-containing protein